MTVETRPLQSRDDALRLQELVYSTYGLTYHRSFMYDAEQLLELNRTGCIQSMMAVDKLTGEVVGHQALIRPYFETAAPLPEGRAAAVMEVGLSIVHPDSRGNSIQNALGLALLMHSAPRNPGCRGYYTKCVTRHLASQKSARKFMGRATALFLAGVPAWVVYDGEEGESSQPITTILLHSPYGDRPERSVPVPETHHELLTEIYGHVGLKRKLGSIVKAKPDKGDSVLRSWFDPARRQGVVRLMKSGGDLIEATLDRVSWLGQGHMKHVTVLMPLESEAVAAAIPVLEDAGLFFGGVIPDLEGTDTLVMQRIEQPALDTSRIRVIGEEAEMLLNEVVRNWGASVAARRRKLAS